MSEFIIAMEIITDSLLGYFLITLTNSAKILTINLELDFYEPLSPISKSSIPSPFKSIKPFEILEKPPKLCRYIFSSSDLQNLDISELLLKIINQFKIDYFEYFYNIKNEIDSRYFLFIFL